MKIRKFLSIALGSVFLISCGGGSSGPVAPASAVVGLALDSPSAPTTLYVANADNQTIQSINLSTSALTTLAGMPGNAGMANGTGSAAQFYEPYAVTVLGGNVYVADTFNYGIRKVTPGGVVTTLAGNLGTVGSADGTGNGASFNAIKGLVGAGNFLYVLDTFNQTVRSVDITSGAVTTVAGYAGTTGSADSVTGTSARFNYPFGIAVDSSNNLYLTDTLNQTIRMISASGAVSTIAGAVGTIGSANGTGSAATFNYPAGIATDGTNLFVADSANHTIRKIVISSGAVSTFAGTSGTAGSANGTGTGAQFNTPTGLTMDNAGNLYVTDQLWTKVRKITSAGVVTTLTTTF